MNQQTDNSFNCSLLTTSYLSCLAFTVSWGNQINGEETGEQSHCCQREGLPHNEASPAAQTQGLCLLHTGTQRQM